MNAPKAPNAAETAKAQTGMNRDTAITNFGLNAVNQQGPLGSLSYNQVGTWEDGTPRFEATTQLGQGAQGVVDNALGAISQPLNLNNDAVESRLMELGQSRLDPMLSQRRASTEQDLFNRGVRPGSEAYNNAMSLVGQGENDAYNELLLNGRNQSISEILLGRNQPINEMNAVLGGQQSGMVNTPGSNMQGVDYAGLVGQQYQNELSSYNNTMSGLGSLASAAGGWMFSDKRLKADKSKVAETDDGVGIYEYRMKGSPMMELGLIAQDVQKKKPNAVRKAPGGLMQVNYREALA